MKKITPLIIALALIAPLAALAHNPRLVEAGGAVEITNPQVSQAFYGQLKNSYQEFKLNLTEPQSLYVNILVPDQAGIKTAILAEVIKVKDSGRVVVGVLDGANFDWTTMYEPFGGDYYRQGPSFEQELEAGQYLIHVSTYAQNEKYVLVVGKQESWPPSEIWQTLKTLPTIKNDFFGEPVWKAYFNYVGLMMLVVVLILAVLIYLAYWFLKRKNGQAKG